MNENWQAYSTYQVLPYGQKNAPIRPQISEISIFKKKNYRPLADEFEIFFRILLRSPKTRCKLYRKLKRSRRYLEKWPRYRGSKRVAPSSGWRWTVSHRFVRELGKGPRGLRVPVAWWPSAFKRPRNGSAKFCLKPIANRLTFTHDWE